MITCGRIEITCGVVTMSNESKFVPLKSLAHVITKGTTPTTEQGYHDTGINFVRAVSMDELGQFDEDDFLKIDEETNSKFSRSVLHESDVLFSIAGVIGRVAVVDQSILPANVNQALAIIRPKMDLIDPSFLSNYLQTPAAKHYFKNRVVESAQANLSLTELGKFPVENIPKNEQLRRNFFLKKIRQMIILNRQLQKLYSEISSSIFYSWFINFDPVINNMNGETSHHIKQNVAQLFPNTFADSELGIYPSGWKEIRLGEILFERREKDGGVNAKEFSCTDKGIFPREHKFSKTLSADPSKNKIARQGDIVFGMSRKILNFGLMRDKFGGVSSAYSVYEVNSELIEPDFVERFMKARHDYYYNLILGSGREGQSIDKKYLPRMKFIIPNREIVDIFYKTIGPIEYLASRLDESNTRLEHVKNLILPQAMSGELSVS